MYTTDHSINKLTGRLVVYIWAKLHLFVLLLYVCTMQLALAVWKSVWYLKCLKVGLVLEMTQSSEWMWNMNKIFKQCIWHRTEINLFSYIFDVWKNILTDEDVWCCYKANSFAINLLNHLLSETHGPVYTGRLCVVLTWVFVLIV